MTSSTPTRPMRAAADIMHDYAEALRRLKAGEVTYDEFNARVVRLFAEALAARDNLRVRLGEL